jgi:putative Mn2+ efflux pump MntP
VALPVLPGRSPHGGAYAGRLTGDTLKLIAFILPLGLDTFGVALALGIAGLPGRSRIRVALLFAGFETAMPLIGVALGVPLGDAVGSAADDIAGALLIGLGVYMLVADDHEDLLSMTQRGVLGAVALGASISLDELAIGFSAGLLRLPILAMVIAIGAQAFVVTLIGVRLGSGVGERWRESAERVAGAALIALGATLLLLRLTG